MKRTMMTTVMGKRGDCGIPPECGPITIDDKVNDLLELIENNGGEIVDIKLLKADIKDFYTAMIIYKE